MPEYMTLSQLLPGDVLVMKGKKSSWLDEMILDLTNSDVSHGAIFTGKDSDGRFQLIDAIESGINLRNLSDSTERTNKQYYDWYVRRMQGKDLSPVISCAKTYIGKAHYDKFWLVMLGCLLLFKKWVIKQYEHESEAKELFERIKAVLFYLDQYGHEEGEDYFVCSQYVTTCFSQAGKAYALDVEGVLPETNGSSVIADLRRQAGVDSQRLANQKNAIEDDVRKYLPDVTMTDSRFEPTSMEREASLFNSLFNKMDSESQSQLRHEFNTYNNAFVTPAYLKSHCRNLSAIGEIGFLYHGDL